MQTTNPTKPGQTVHQTGSSSIGTIKSFTDLSGALITKEIDLFAEQVRKGIDNWRTAGKILVELSSRQPDIFRMIQARHPSIHESTLQTFARIGRNEIWPPLLVESSLGARKLLECNYDLQKEYSINPIDVAIEWKNGSIKTVKRKVTELSRAECAVVFDGKGGINNLDQQAFRLRSANSNLKPAAPVAKPDHTKETPVVSVRLKNVDVGYYEVVVSPDGRIAFTPCGKSTIAQPVRLMESGLGSKSMKAVIVFYKQEYQ